MPKIVDHDRYRKELLKGCLDLFAARGYGSITMRQIAKGLGVSTGTLYHYFPSKESIFIQLVQELCEQDIYNFLAQAPEVDDLEGRLQAIMDFVLQHRQYYHQQLLLWMDFSQQTRPNPDSDIQALREVWQRTRELLAGYLQLSKPELVDFVMVFIDGLVLQYIYDHGCDVAITETPSFEQQSQLMIQMVMHHEQNCS
ncbi:transcriptional regulator [Leptolyngbya sp. Heron Island J]|uniref:TetR/AcrR family transcriptional regulator n=1 Tax=Leptolyngbya sp. Heron Island J TaxID=1385935 RepID=UPI0003B9DABE|nr:TetR/AcrR family transcriptional regulator [Leptolyngbya sp. Heron Island J]ESA36376.1 transcriptional regulator [Leptolyngbya sp. Heron Island J]